MRRRRSRPHPVKWLIGLALIGGVALLAQTASTPSRLVPGGIAARIRAPALPLATPPIETALASLPNAAAEAGPGAAASPAAGEASGSSGPAPPVATVEARPGDTALTLLDRLGVAPEDARAAVRKLRTIWDPRDLRVGQKAAVFVQSDRLLSIRLALAPDRDVVVARDATGSFVAEDQDRPTRAVPTLGGGTIDTSLAAATSRAGVPAGVLGEMIRAFSYDVDFQREVRPGDRFMVLYDRVDDEFGHATGLGHLTYA
jgi:hypothetical protein